ncbi:Bug family tripartite tricarboxylate transporter substrate binding protein [uncultured Bradyrhizobium sp.]|uniref:Bug family tripartite tricarboxylate transporter substrate binding protein n=1 Tax=uncultured Bradyrhizobium sp. TaxID=199684 RepID=UPI0035CAB5B5
MNRRRFLRLLPVSVLIASAARSAYAASEWPVRPIRIVVPFPPGGSVDTLARVIGPALSDRFGQAIVIDNRSGAGGAIGTAEAARSPADGYTLLMVYDTHAVNHHLHRRLPYDTFTAFRPISLLATSPMVLITPTRLEVRTVEDLIALARSRPEGLSVGHAGAGSSNQLLALQFSSQANITINQIPYRGAAPMLNDVVGGHLDFVISALPAVLPQVKAGTVRALAVTTAKAAPQLPDVPPLATAVPGFEGRSWVGLLVPAAVPDPAAEQLEQAVRTILNDRAIRARLEETGYHVEGSDAGTFLSFLHAESDRWGAVIKRYGISSSE